MEALKAQAVAARSYTLSRMSARQSHGWDVTDTVQDQVYLGTPSGCAKCSQAVDDTRGIILSWNGQPAETLYTASNGGQTESALNVWGSQGYDYLTVRDDPYDLANPLSPTLSHSLPKQLSEADTVWRQLLTDKVTALLGSSGFTLVTANQVRLYNPRYE